MLPDSMNVGVIAENIKKLETMVQEAGSELPTPGAGDTGKIIKVGSTGYELSDEYSYTPPAFSTTEIDTGIKYGEKNVYQITFIGTTPEEIGTYSFGTLANYESVLHIYGSIRAASGFIHAIERGLDITVNVNNGSLGANITAGYNGQNYIVTVLYTKVTPGNETKKKTSKKGE